jgi:quinol monooxygenase YgiN
LETHRNAPHYKKWSSTVEPWLDGDRERVMMTTVFPSDQGWKDQKPCLLNW